MPATFITWNPNRWYQSCKAMIETLELGGSVATHSSTGRHVPIEFGVIAWFYKSVTKPCVVLTNAIDRSLLRDLTRAI